MFYSLLSNQFERSTAKFQLDQGSLFECGYEQQQSNEPLVTSSLHNPRSSISTAGKTVDAEELRKRLQQLQKRQQNEQEQITSPDDEADRDDDLESEDRRKHHEEFQKHRRDHYDEFRVVQRLR